MGSSITAVLTRVKDFVGNSYENDVNNEMVCMFLHTRVNETEAKVTFDIVLNRACTPNDGEFKGEIAAFVVSLKDQS
jgi:hypothetical protein